MDLNGCRAVNNNGIKCSCVNCRQGKLTKEQYIREIRARLQPEEINNQRRSERNCNINRRSSSVRSSWLTSSNWDKKINDSNTRRLSEPSQDILRSSVNNNNTRKLKGTSQNTAHYAVNNGKTKLSDNSQNITVTEKNTKRLSGPFQDNAYQMQMGNHLAWVDQTMENHTKNSSGNSKMIYYVDEEQPSDIESYSEMVNGKSTDPRILPTIIKTIKYLRRGYHQMLLSMKPKSREFFEREFAKLERNRFYTKEKNRNWSTGGKMKNRNSLTDESDSGAEWIDARQSPAKKRNGFVTPIKNDIINRDYINHDNHDSDWSYSGSDSGVTLRSDGEEHVINQSALHMAALNGDTNEAMYLILKGCDVNGLGQDGWPAIEFALRGYKFRCAIFLVEAGTNMLSYTTKKLEEYSEVVYRGRRYLQFIQTSL